MVAQIVGMMVGSFGHIRRGVSARGKCDARLQINARDQLRGFLLAVRWRGFASPESACLSAPFRENRISLETLQCPARRDFEKNIHRYTTAR
jgi:hypothetical protein